MDDTIKKAGEILANYSGPKLRIMEVCGTHTHEIFRLGIRKILPEGMEMISGPGCPVCVTPADYIDEAVWLALKKGCIICTFGDLIRVPGSEKNLADTRSEGGDIRMVYTPLDAVEVAAQNPDRQTVFLSVGFETTTPSSCLAVKKAAGENLKNFSLLTANKTMPQAYEALKGSADAFLYPGHVHAITGEADCRRLLSEGVSGVIAGFTAKELMTALAVIAVKSAEGEPYFVNCYPRVVRPEGSLKGVRIINEVMEPCDAEWRGLGEIPGSGLKLKGIYADFDARIKHDIPKICGHGNPACRCGEVLQGNIRPTECPLFNRACTPDHPVGACMVSNEGSCSAFFQYGM